MVNVAAIKGQPMVVALSAGDKQIAADSLSIDELATALHVNVRAIWAPSPRSYRFYTTDWGNDRMHLALTHTVHWIHLAMRRKYYSVQSPVASYSQAKLLSNRNGYVDGAWSDGQRAASIIIRNL